MTSPSIPRFNGQIKTPWRGGYTSPLELSENSPECRDEMEGCGFQLIWKTDSLMPFQFVRPFAMSAVTSWKLYDSSADDAALLVDLTDQIDKLSYYAATLSGGGSIQYVTYPGTILESVLPAGVYYMRIVSGGITYYWEPLRIVCDYYGQNVFPEDSFEYFLKSDESNDSRWVWNGNTAMRVIAVAGEPTNPLLQIAGWTVINTADSSTYFYDGSAWTQNTSPDTRPWYDYHTGAFYRFIGGAWVGIAAPLSVQDAGACWTGALDADLTYDMSEMSCLETQVRIEITVSGRTTGTLQAFVSEGDGGGSTEISGNGTFSFTSYLGNGYLLNLQSEDSFDGCVNMVEVFCLSDMQDCYFGLAWSNCGNIGNNYLADGYTHEMYFDQAVYPVRPQPETTIITKQRADGSLMETSRRRETTWQIQVGMVPWHIADSLADIPMYDTVVMRNLGGGVDRLTRVRVSVENDEEFAECFKSVTISFQIDSASVSCCDEFTQPCGESCVDAQGFTDASTPVADSIYLVAGASAWSTFRDDTFTAPTQCNSGVASILSGSDFQHTVYFDLNDGTWKPVALLGSLDVTLEAPGECVINILAVVRDGYSAILQYLDEDDNWVDDPAYDLSAAEWLDNDILRAVPEGQAASNRMRLKVYVDGVDGQGRPQNGQCVLGYSPEFDYECE